VIVANVNMTYGFWKAPWWPVIAAAFILLTRLGIGERRAFAVLVPLTGLGWTRLGNGRRSFFILRGFRKIEAAADAL
jgi:hypothetical protein